MTKMHRFIGKYQLARGTIRIDDADLAHQMRSVLKLVTGETVVVGDGTGLEATCNIISYDHNAVFLECVSLDHNTAELPGQTILYCAMLKADHFEMAAQKATEVGVTEIVPIVTKRTVKLNVRIDRVQAIVREAAEQSGRGIIPVVHEITPIEKAFSQASHHDANFFFDPSGGPFTGAAKSARHAGIWIGPEGGWEEGETKIAEDAGMKIVTLGTFIVRAETAVIIASYLVANSLKN